MFSGFGNFGSGSAGDIVSYVGLVGGDQYRNELRKIDSAVTKTRINTEGESRKMSAAFKNLAKVSAVVFAAIAIGSTVMAAKFETKMANVYTLLDVSHEKFEQFSKDVLKVSTIVGKSADDLAVAAYDMVSAGADLTQGIKPLELAAKAAVAGVTDTQTAVRAGMVIINSYALELSDLNKVYDLQFKTVKKGVLNFAQYANAIGTVVPQATALGVELEDLHAAIAVLTKSGQSADMATTNLARAFMSFVEQRKNFEKLGIEIFNAEGKFRGLLPVISDLANVMNGLTNEEKQNVLQLLQLDIRAARAIIPLTNLLDTSGGLRETFDEMTTSAGAMNTAFQKIEQTTAHMWDKFKANLESIIISIGSKLLPVLNKLFTGFENFLKEKHLKFITYQYDQLRQKHAELFGELNKVRTAMDNVNQSSAIYVHLAAKEKDLLEKLSANLKEMNAISDELYPTTQAVSKATEELGNNFGKTGKKIKESTEKLNAWYEALVRSNEIEEGRIAAQEPEEDIPFFGDVTISKFDQAALKVKETMYTLQNAASDALNAIDSGMWRVADGLVAAMGGAKVNLAKIFKSIADDFVRIFLKYILDQTIAYVAKLVVTLIFFDKPVNDMMAYRSGQDFVKFFSGGIDNGFKKANILDRIMPQISPSIDGMNAAPLRANDLNAMLKVKVEGIFPEGSKVNAYFKQVNRDINIPDTKYHNEFLSTNNETSEFD